jgi:ABC-2 type transport system ATP-binding protein
MGDPLSETGPVLVATDLVQAFRERQMLFDLSLSIPAGEVHGLLGSNGAGKTTTLNILAGLVPPVSGQVRIDGKSVWPDPTPLRSLIGYVADEPIFLSQLTAREHLDLFAKAFGYQQELPKRTVELLKLVGLNEHADERVAGFSRGMKKRFALALALVPDPLVLLLDEPTVGLDPRWIRRVRELITELANQGKTIIFSSHLLELVESVVQRATILSNGRVLASGALSELRSKAVLQEGADLEEVFFALTDHQDHPDAASTS